MLRRQGGQSRQAVAAAATGRTRLLDVARAANVSTMTVVRVLREPHKVAVATRERVEKVLADTGYTPDLVARGLVSNKSGLVGAVVPLLTNSLIAEIVQGLSEMLARDGIHLLLGQSGFSLAEEEVLVRAFLSRRIDAIFLSGVSHTSTTIRMLKQAAIPVVEGGNLTKHPIDMVVGYSNVKAAREVTEYLLAAGYRKVGYIGAFPTDNDRARDRRHGYDEAISAAGGEPDPTLCVETTLDIDAGAVAMAALLARHPDVRAVFCSADALAVGALFECQRRKIAVPERVALAGFDDLAIAARVVPSLTTLRVPRYFIGQQAGKLILDRLAGKAIRRRIVDTGFEFVRRDSA